MKKVFGVITLVLTMTLAHFTKPAYAGCGFLGLEACADNSDRTASNEGQHHPFSFTVKEINQKAAEHCRPNILILENEKECEGAQGLCKIGYLGCYKSNCEVTNDGSYLCFQGNLDACENQDFEKPVTTVCKALGPNQDEQVIRIIPGVVSTNTLNFNHIIPIAPFENGGGAPNPNQNPSSENPTPPQFNPTGSQTSTSQLSPQPEGEASASGQGGGCSMSTGDFSKGSIVNALILGLGLFPLMTRRWKKTN